ncbi:MAG: cytochrome c oxidase assembly protein [Candidatus Thiodiazotropha sp. (ex Monitilora ramsayi)]|nr:cytochrome c oxidase assembly protein [Candidatus Thiodiazotropha sp. (ex Monitilora ramsayi)]
MNDQASQNHGKNRRTTLLLSGLVVAMFGFGFAMVPLYNLFCEVTGTQSLSQRSEIGRVVATDESVDTSRWVTVKFDTTVHPNLPWAFDAMTQKLRVHPGKTYEVNFVARNRSNETVTGQAIPSVAPWQATPYFSKMDCFCFNRQTLKGTERADMPLQFMVSRDLPKEINSLTLSYSFMRLKESETETETPEIPNRIAVNAGE